MFTGADNKVIVWNVNEDCAVFEIQHPDIPQCLSWNFDGSLIATTCKDKILRVADVRAEKFIQVCVFLLSFFQEIRKMVQNVFVKKYKL